MFGIINIYSKSENEIARKLSNFYPHVFSFDGIDCDSYEAFLQSLKFPLPDEQLEIIHLDAKTAKEMGQTRSWQETGWLYWKGEPINRYSKAYRQLLECAYDALCKNKNFSSALLHGRGHLLIHSVGKLRKKETVLTSLEFCSILMQKRRKLLRDQRNKGRGP